MMRILVTGATGGLGRNAVAHLLNQGCMVRATGRNSAIGRHLESQGVQFVPLDMATASERDLGLLARDIDAVWHCAARSAPWGPESDFIASNVIATSKLLTAAGRSGVKHFVHVSTSALYFDFCHQLNVPETFQPSRYVNAYARTKAMAEARVLEAVSAYPDMRGIILRPRAIFGEHDQVLMPRLARMLHRHSGRLPLPRGGSVNLDLTYVGNVVHAMWLATVRPDLVSGDIFNITNHQPVILREVLKKLFVEELALPLHILALPYPLLGVVGQLAQWLASVTGKEPALTPYSLGTIHFDMTLSNDRALKVLGYQPRFSLAEGLTRTAHWLRESGRG